MQMYVSGCDVFVSWCGSIAYFSALFVTNFDTTSTIVGPRTLLLCFIIQLFFASAWSFTFYRCIVYLFLTCARSFTFYRFTITFIIMQVYD